MRLHRTASHEPTAVKEVVKLVEEAVWEISSVIVECEKTNLGSRDQLVSLGSGIHTPHCCRLGAVEVSSKFEFILVFLLGAGAEAPKKFRPIQI